MGPAQAFRANAATFYDLQTKEKTPLLSRYLALAAAAAILQLSGVELSPQVLTILIPLVGVLLGFGFSVQFYIASTTLPKEGESNYLEDAGDIRILSTASAEVYDNVVYFNYVALGTLLPTFSLLFPMPQRIASEAWLAAAMENGGGFLAWLFVLETLTTFYRVLGRASYFFSERRRLV